MPKLSDSEVLAICNAEIDSASGYSSGELAQDRSEAMDFYLGEPYGDETEGRSQYRSREVLETVQNLMPSLMRIFGDAENIVSFDPVGPEDTEQAQQESDRVNHCFWKENRGFFNAYTFVQDAMLSKTGILKAWIEEGKEEREEYSGITALELSQLAEDTTAEREIIEASENDDGTFDVTFITKDKAKVCIEPVPAEELGVNRDARTPYAQDAKFLYHRTRKTYSDLIEEGYDKKIIDTLPTNDDVETEERLARRHIDDEQDLLRFGVHKSTRTYWITECYTKLDRNGDDIAEQLKVTIAAGAGEASSGSRLLRIEEVDAIDIFTAPPHILTHKFYGLSIADLVIDVQRIISTLSRQMLDNTYLTNNSRTHVNGNVNRSDMLTKRPGGIVRHKGETSPAANMAPEPVTPLSSDTYGLLEHFDNVIKSRTGATDDIAGLDANALSKLNTGVAAMALDRARMKVELIAKILAEVGFRPLFQHIHSLLQKYQDKREVLELRGKWVEVNPSEWRERKNVTVNVGLGVASRERKMMTYQDLWEKQQQVVAGGGLGTIVSADNVYALMSDYVEATGFDSERYFMDPQKAPPPPPPPPDPQMAIAQMMAQVEMRKAQNDEQKNQIELMKVQRDGQISMVKLGIEKRENELSKQIEQIRLDKERLSAEHQAAQGNAKIALETELKVRDMELKEVQMQLDLYKTMLQTGAKLDVEAMKQANAAVDQAEE